MNTLPLPAPFKQWYHLDDGEEPTPVYTAEQMREYAEAVSKINHDTVQVGIARPGDILIFEVQVHLTLDEFHALSIAMRKACEALGVKSFVLEKNIRLARVERDNG